MTVAMFQYSLAFCFLTTTFLSWDDLALATVVEPVTTCAAGAGCAAGAVAGDCVCAFSSWVAPTRNS